MKLLTATIVKPARQVATKYGTRTVTDAIDQNGNEQTIWRPANDPVLTGLSVNSPITLAVDSKGKISLVDNQDKTAIATNPEPTQSSDLSNTEKRAIAEYITQQTKLFSFCYAQTALIENLPDEDRRPIATTLFLGAVKKFNLA